MVAGRTGQHGYLYVDSQEKREAFSPGSAYSFDAFTPLYIGGVPDFTRLSGLVTGYFYQGFNGIITEVTLINLNIELEHFNSTFMNSVSLNS